MPVAKGQKGMSSCLKEFGRGELHHGSTGEVVTKRSMAIAICLNKSGQSKGAPPAKGQKR